MFIPNMQRVGAALGRLWALAMVVALFLHGESGANHLKQRYQDTQGHPVGSVAEQAASKHIAGSLTDAEWNAIRAEYDYHQRVVIREGNDYWARNPGQRWITRFNGRGFLVTPQTGDWTWGLALQSFGVVGEERVVRTPVHIFTGEHRLSYTWEGGVEEWFDNGAAGLEHGFTLKERPSGDGDRVRFVLNVEGGLIPRATDDHLGATFLDSKSGSTVVRYDGLKVWDSTGAPLRASLETAGNQLFIEIDAKGARYPITIDPVAQQAYLKASNAEIGDFFGQAVAISGDTVVVGAFLESSSATGVNGNESNNSRPGAGAAYVFVRDGGVWAQQAYLKPQFSEFYGLFGMALDIDGDTIVVTAQGEDNSEGAAYVFTRSSGVWTQQARLVASNADISDVFGMAVSISGDVIVVGAIQESSNATGVNGNQSNNSAGNAGAAYVFRRSGSTWTQEAYLKASNTTAQSNFGYGVAISDDLIAVGAPFEDTSGSNSGAVYLYRYQSGSWVFQSMVKASSPGANDEFGGAVALDGNTLVVGARLEDSNATGVNGNPSNNSALNSGAAYIFTVMGSNAIEDAYLKASNTQAGDEFGGFVAIHGDLIAVGARLEDSNATGIDGNGANNGETDAGAAYLFTRGPDDSWVQTAYIKASNAQSEDQFGTSIALSDTTLVVGAPLESSANTNQNNNSATYAGAAYVFDLPLPAFEGIFDNPEVVSEERRNRVVSRIELRVDVVSSSDFAYPDVQATVDIESPGHQVVPGSNTIQCGAVEAHETKTCTGTFLLDWDRRYPLDVASLEYEILP